MLSVVIGMLGTRAKPSSQQALQRRAVLRGKFLEDDHRAIQFARYAQQRVAERFGRFGFCRIITVEMPFAGGASDHQRARSHEAGPKPAHAADDFRHDPAHAGEKILVDQEIRLDGADGAIVLDEQIAVAESVLQRVFEKFVVAVIFSLLREGGLPLRQAGNFRA